MTTAFTAMPEKMTKSTIRFLVGIITALYPWTDVELIDLDQDRHFPEGGR
jgi:hypothetical protein